MSPRGSPPDRARNGHGQTRVVCGGRRIAPRLMPVRVEGTVTIAPAAIMLHRLRHDGARCIAVTTWLRRHCSSGHGCGPRPSPCHMRLTVVTCPAGQRSALPVPHRTAKLAGRTVCLRRSDRLKPPDQIVVRSAGAVTTPDRHVAELIPPGSGEHVTAERAVRNLRRMERECEPRSPRVRAAVPVGGDRDWPEDVVGQRRRAHGTTVARPPGASPRAPCTESVARSVQRPSLEGCDCQLSVQAKPRSAGTPMARE